ncbi:MAG TPA: hypothetical protein VEL07_21165 [Planctomycetota bacterium]|nr:hypothetical protein [Planctomycetota bacterium]
MRPDMRKPVQAGWATLGGALAIGLIALALVGAGDGVDLDSVRADYARRHGKRDFARLISEQRHANGELARTIDDLKYESGMSANPYFRVPPGEYQKGVLFKDRLFWVQDRLRPLAKGRSVEFNEDLGFGQWAHDLPPDAMTPDLLLTLQVVYKAATIALSTTESNFVSIAIEPDLKPVLAGAKDRPLLTEYPLTLKVVGSLKDILWVLHRFSQVEPSTVKAREEADDASEQAEEAAIVALYPKLSERSGTKALSKEDAALLDDWVARHDYPLIISRLVIDGGNTSEKDQVTQLTATFTVAGMRFLDDAQRAGAPAAKARTGGAGPRTAAGAARGAASGAAREARP